MTNKKSTKRALLMSALSLLLCFSMLIGTTYAWFTDSVTSAGNKIVAGNLDVELYVRENNAWAEITESSDPLFDGNILWEPGYTLAKVLMIRNAGSLALKWQAKFVADAELSELADVIDVYVSTSATEMPADRADIATWTKAGTVRQFIAAMDTNTNGSLMPAGEAGDIAYLGIALKMQESAGNEYMNKALTSAFDIQILATQLTAEEDSFGSDYDSTATYPKRSLIYNLPDGAAEPMKLDTDDMTVDLPAPLIENLPDEIKKLQVVHTEARIDTDNKAVVFDSVELIDQDGEKVDLEALGNTEPVAVTLSVQGSFAAGERVYIYHDDELVAMADVDANGNVSYEAEHFCEVSVSDTRIAEIASAEELIAILTEVKTEAKKQIPGENGNKKYRENVHLILVNDVVIDGNTEFMYTDSNGAPLHFYGVKGVLDLNGHSITVTEDALMEGKTNANAALLIQYSDLDIVGEGSIVARNRSIPVYGWANGTVNIYGGTYITNASERNESAIYVNNATMVIHVYGGNFAQSGYAFNAHDNCKTNTVMVLHEGVSCPKFLKDGKTDVFLSDINGGRLQVAEGCTLKEVEIDGEAWYTVVAE